MEYLDGTQIDLYLSGSDLIRRMLVDDILYLTRSGRNVRLFSQDGPWTFGCATMTFAPSCPSGFSTQSISPFSSTSTTFRNTGTPP